LFEPGGKEVPLGKSNARLQGSKLVETNSGRKKGDGKEGNPVDCPYNRASDSGNPTYIFWIPAYAGMTMAGEAPKESLRDTPAIRSSGFRIKFGMTVILLKR
jgi:hypothetical protein